MLAKKVNARDVIKLYLSFVVVFSIGISVIFILSKLSLYWLIPVVFFPISALTYKFRNQESVLGGLVLMTILGGIYGLLACIVAYGM